MSTGLQRSQRRSLFISCAIGAVVLLAVGVIGGHFLWPQKVAAAVKKSDKVASEQTYQYTATANGPKKIDKGVPLGYTKTADGAIAAAVNWVRLGGLSSIFTQTPDPRSVILAKNSALTVEKLYLTGPASLTTDLTLPEWASADITGDTGTIRIVVYKTRGAGPTVLVGLQTFGVIWENGDWRMLTAQFVSIPDGQTASTIDQYKMHPVQGYITVLPTK